jgi:hypothetical protein
MNYVTHLDHLKNYIETAIADGSREYFCHAFSLSWIGLGVTDLELAKMFEISRPTVSRWARGEAAPHQIGRRPVLEHLLKLVEERIVVQHKILKSICKT